MSYRAGVRRIILSVVVLQLVASGSAQAQLRTQAIASGLGPVVGVVPDPVYAGVLHVIQQDGIVRTIQGTSVLATPFLDVRTVISSGGERGLLGLAFAPDTAGGRVFVNFTDQSGNTVIARFRRSAANPLAADPASRLDLRWPNGARFISQPYANHNGGNLAFGPDGYLYIGLGDGGSANDPQNHAQNPSSLLGKMLRIDVNVDDSDGNGYRIPGDNPFVGGIPIAALGEIWAIGLRNPWRYSFDNRALGGTGALFIADVGQNAREEVNLAAPGRGGQNYGWRMREGTIATPGVPATTPAFTPLTEPLLDYGRSTGTTVIGGYVYRGRALGAAYYGRYFLGDLGSGHIWSIAWAFDAAGRGVVTDVVDHTPELGVIPLVAFAEDRDGELYVASYDGRVLKLIAPAAAPAAPANLTSQTSGRTVTLAWSGAAGATGYRIEAGSRAGAVDLATIDTGSGSTSFTATSVGDGVYYVRVRALAGTAASSASNEVIVTVGGATPCSAPPSAPGGLTASVSNRIVTLGWSASGSISSFVLEAGYAPGASTAAVIVVDAAARTFSSSAPPATYYVRVRAVNACGASGPSNETTVIVP
jgi:glucose/arabinose dehydrogenase